MRESEFHVGMTVWTVDRITKKSTGEVVGATIGEYRVLSYDGHCAALVHDLHGEERDGKNILDLIGVEFVDLHECFSNRYKAEKCRELLLEGLESLQGRRPN